MVGPCKIDVVHILGFWSGSYLLGSCERGIEYQCVDLDRLAICAEIIYFAAA